MTFRKIIKILKYVSVKYIHISYSKVIYFVQQRYNEGKLEHSITTFLEIGAEFEVEIATVIGETSKYHERSY